MPARTGSRRSATAGLAPPFRCAARADCRRLAELVEIAGAGIPGHLWVEAGGAEADPLTIGAGRLARANAAFSWRNAVVAELDGAVVALLLAYRLPERSEPAAPADPPALIRPLLELELLVPGSFYLNALAALPGYRDRGLGSGLLAIAEARARAAGCDLLSVQVFAQNEGAVRLYRRHGYRERARRPVVPHPCHPYDTDIVLMTRSLPAR
jgi:ribosomal protein S18 acetylase RimI-like enzyme